MNLAGVSIPLAAAAGAASFLSPCVLPLVPAYVGFLGQAAVEPAGGGAVTLAQVRRARVLQGGVGFVLGLSLFLLAFFYVFYRVLEPLRHTALPVFGAIVIVLGLGFMGLFRLPFLSRELRWMPSGFDRGGLAAGFLLGLGIAAGWTPCIGPVLGAVLSSGLAQGTTSQGLLAMVAYCVGLAAPFLVVSLLLDRAGPVLRVFNRHQRAVELLGGLLIVAMGVLVVVDNVTLLNSWFSAHLPAWFQDPFNL